MKGFANFTRVRIASYTLNVQQLLLKTCNILIYNHNLDALLKQYEEIFRNELGQWKHIKTRLHNKPEAVPKFILPQTDSSGMLEMLISYITSLIKESNGRLYCNLVKQFLLHSSIWDTGHIDVHWNNENGWEGKTFHFCRSDG